MKCETCPEHIKMVTDMEKNNGFRNSGLWWRSAIISIIVGGVSYAFAFNAGYGENLRQIKVNTEHLALLDQKFDSIMTHIDTKFEYMYRILKGEK